MRLKIYIVLIAPGSKNVRQKSSPCYDIWKFCVYEKATKEQTDKVVLAQQIKVFYLCASRTKIHPGEKYIQDFQHGFHKKRNKWYIVQVHGTSGNKEQVV